MKVIDMNSPISDFYINRYLKDLIKLKNNIVLNLKTEKECEDVNKITEG